MQRYYLHLHNGLGFSEDEEGVELPDLAAARKMAVAAVRDLVSSEAKRGMIDLRGRIDIAIDRSNVVAAVAFTDAIEVRQGALP